MRQMTKSAKKVAEYIRKNVPRPKKLPKIDYVEAFSENLWMVSSLGLRFYGKWCPMGLLKEATNPAPIDPFELEPMIFSRLEMKSFARWWDKQKDPEEAVKAVWG